MQNLDLDPKSFRAPFGLMFALLALGSGACAASVPQVQRTAPSGLDLAQGWPSGASQHALEGFGAAQHAARTPSPAVDISAFVVPPIAAKSEAKPTPKRVKPQLIARVIEAPTPAPEVATTAPLPTPTITLMEPASADANLYAARDQDAQKQKQFRGGDAIVITTGTIVLVLLILLLVLILT